MRSCRGQILWRLPDGHILIQAMISSRTEIHSKSYLKLLRGIREDATIWLLPLTLILDLIASPLAFTWNGTTSFVNQTSEASLRCALWSCKLNTRAFATEALSRVRLHLSASMIEFSALSSHQITNSNLENTGHGRENRRGRIEQGYPFLKENAILAVDNSGPSKTQNEWGLW